MLRAFGPFSGSNAHANHAPAPSGRRSLSRAPSLTPSSSISNRGGRDRSNSTVNSSGLFRAGYENDYPAAHPRTGGTRAWEEEEGRGRSRASRASRAPPLSGALVRANRWAESRVGSRFGGSRAPSVGGRSGRSGSVGGSVRQGAGGMTYRE